MPILARGSKNRFFAVFSNIIINEIQQLGDDEKENFQKFGEFYSSSIIESEEQKRRIKKQLLNIKNQGSDTVIIVKSVKIETIKDFLKRILISEIL